MHDVAGGVAVCPGVKDLPSKNRVWGFRTPARYRIRKSASQAAESRQENAPTPTKTASGIGQFLLTDQVGTLRVVADTSGNIVKRIDYDSFGNIIADSNPSFSVPFGFAGGLHDRDTGLVRFGYRDYSPELGRWTAKDPIDFAGGDTNLYAYAMSDPINFVDPWGLEVVFSRTGESVRYAYDRIKQTTRGKEIATRLEGSSQTYRIHVLPGSKGVGNYSDPKNTVLLPEVFTDGDVMTNLAHELGHAYQDDMVQPIEQIPNILDNENPIRSELGYPKRCP